LSDLRRAKIKTLDGETLGRLHEIHCDGGRIVAIMCGPGSFIERLTAKKQGRRIPWEYVKRIEHKQVIVAADPPQRNMKKSTAAPNRQGTRRPSAPRSKR
jgi:sporulation protein YlmC with PRC-barrel domain